MRKNAVFATTKICLIFSQYQQPIRFFGENTH